jgi:hypothetical protein
MEFMLGDASVKGSAESTKAKSSASRKIVQVCERVIEWEASHCGELDFHSVPDQATSRSMKPF